jgi:hypothetical protein
MINSNRIPKTAGTAPFSDAKQKEESINKKENARKVTLPALIHEFCRK